MTAPEIQAIAPAEVQWAIVDQQGHNRHVGIIDEHTYAGTQYIRVRTPTSSGEVKESLIGPTSVYAMQKISEERALRMLGLWIESKPLIEQREEFHLTPHDSDDDLMDDSDEYSSDDDSDLCGDEETDLQ
jgi:hypothetical protein